MSQRVLLVARHLIVAIQPPRKDHLVIVVRVVRQHLFAEDDKVLSAALFAREELQATLGAVGEDVLEARLPVRMLQEVHLVSVLDLPRQTHCEEAGIKPELVFLCVQLLQHVSDDVARAVTDAIGLRVEPLLAVEDLITQIADARELLCLLHGNSLLDDFELLVGEVTTNGSGGLIQLRLLACLLAVLVGQPARLVLLLPSGSPLDRCLDCRRSWSRRRSCRPLGVVGRLRPFSRRSIAGRGRGRRLEFSAAAPAFSAAAPSSSAAFFSAFFSAAASSAAAAGAAAAAAGFLAWALLSGYR